MTKEPRLARAIDHVTGRSGPAAVCDGLGSVRAPAIAANFGVGNLPRLGRRPTRDRPGHRRQHRHLHVLPNGQALQRLTTDPLFDACPAGSADGKHIAWCHGVQRGSGVIDVWTMKQDGSEKRQVTDLGGRAIFPDFSPDGSKIVFTGRSGRRNQRRPVRHRRGRDRARPADHRPGDDGNPGVVSEWRADRLHERSDRRGPGLRHGCGRRRRRPS